MADTEVENVLREIRDRVRAEAESAALSSPTAAAADVRAPAESAPGALARLEASLSTTERTWGRLPPLVSNRTGLAARFELWVKRLVKRALHWFTWEQVNFNSATHHALRDAAAALAEHERLLAAARADAGRAEARFHEALAAAVTQLRAEGQSLAGNLVQLRDEQRARADAADAAREERLAEMRRELSEELRVCLRQLSLEAGEAAGAHDRARRHLETRLDAIEKVLKADG